ncbi:MAG: HEAT repeat domain-containing protein [Planctomycetes bacterium]|nr:HEAT repeat domain-containing protein [Planctomycetota bacterium]
MAMYPITALLLAFAAPQGPESAATTTTETGIVAAESVLPADAIAVVSVNDLDGEGAALGQTRLGETWRRLTASPGFQQLGESVALWLEDGTELDVATLTRALTHGASLALVHDPRSGRVDWLCAMLVDSDAASFRTALDRLAERPGEGPHALRGPWSQTRRPLAAIAGPWLLVGSSERLVRDAMQRAAAPTDATDALARAPAYAAACGDALLSRGARPAITVHVDLKTLVARALAELPAPARTSAMPWIEALGLGRIKHATLLVDDVGGRVRERLLVGCPTPRTALLNALLPTGARPGGELATLAPHDVVAFSVAAIDLPGAWQAIRSVLAGSAPDTNEMIDASIQGLREQIGIDLERDLLLNLGRRLVLASSPGQDGALQQLAVLDAPNPERLATALHGLVTHDSSRLPGFELFTPADGAPLPAFAVGAPGLVIASDVGSLRRWLNARRGAIPHPRIAELLAAAAPDAIGVSWTADVAAAGGVELSLDGAGAGALPPQLATLLGGGGRGALDSLVDALREIGEVTQEVTANERGLGLSLRSDGGVVSPLCLVAAHVAIEALADQVATDPSLGSVLARRTRIEAGQVRALAAVRDAELTFRAREGRFAGLDELLATGLVPDVGLSGPRRRDVHELGDHLLGTLLPEDTAAPQHVAIVVWPDREERGVVLLATDELPPHRNELLARHAGLATTTLHDVFAGGRFGTPLTPGWREVEFDDAGPDTPQQTPPSTGAAPAGADETVKAVVLALEARGPDAAEELAEFLDADDPTIVARVAWSLGRGGYAAAAPKLGDLAVAHPDTQVRLQAMAALRTLRAKAGYGAAIQGLADPDPTIRAQAAGLLGQLGDRNAIDPLVAFVTSPRDDADRSAPDRALAILALADLGCTEGLGEVAAAIETPTAAESQALAFAYQQLSPTLPKEQEVVALIGVLENPSPLLRRYAIQRLGELADPLATRALERSLARESKELRPLVEVSLAAVRGAVAAAADDRATAPTNAPAQSPWWKDRTVQQAGVAGLGALIVLGAGLSIVLRRLRRRRDAEQWAGMVEPSEGFVEEGAAEDYLDDRPLYDEQYEGEVAFEDEGAPPLHAEDEETASAEDDRAASYDDETQDDESEFEWPLDEADREIDIIDELPPRRRR